MLKKVIVVLMSLTVLFSISSPAVAAVNESSTTNNTYCSDCLTEIPDSTGSIENVKKTEEIVYSSDVFINTSKAMSGTFDKKQAIITAPNPEENTENSDFSFLVLPVVDSEDGFSNAMFVVDLRENEVVNVRNVFITSSAENEAQLKIEDNGELVGDYTVTPNTVKDNLSSTEQSYEDILSDNNNNEGIQLFGWCENAVYALKTVASTGQCIITCGALGLATGGFGGVACSVVCALLLNKPLESVLNDVCN